MKKVYDWDIKIIIHLPDTKQSLPLTVSIFTTFHELAQKVAFELGFSSIETSIQFTIQGQKYAPKPQQNLRQMDVKTGAVLVAKLLNYQAANPKPQQYTDKWKLMSKEEFHDYEPKISQQTYGLIAEGICAYQKCMNQGKTITVPLGFGEFSLDYIQNKMTCPACPNKHLHIIPPLSVTNLRLCNCLWTVYGYYKDRKGVTIYKKADQMKMVHGEENTMLYHIIEKYDWTDMKIVVKVL